MNSARTVCITIRGQLSSRLAETFDGMVLQRRGRATDLIGRVADQAQLHGLLTRIRDLGLELVAVTSSDVELDAGDGGSNT